MGHNTFSTSFYNNKQQNMKWAIFNLYYLFRDLNEWLLVKYLHLQPFHLSLSLYIFKLEIGEGKNILQGQNRIINHENELPIPTQNIYIFILTYPFLRVFHFESLFLYVIYGWKLDKSLLWYTRLLSSYLT